MAEEEENSKVNRHNLTSTQQTQKQLEKLFKKIDKPIVIPETRKDKSVKAPKDFVRNVPGSSAGAGSGDFHVYRAHRRREYARIKNMDDAERKEQDEQEYEDKIARLKAEDEARTAKKRARRQKRKQTKEQTGDTEKKQKTDK
ncbi:hypothetical protein INT45_010059 [Circinella minor]|uniref:DUF1168-domain-containing protein n=1 Tax=Circinella minor TaxID=1195481 RepID=A0A8H7SBE7_9FUNG|nr:hypothetical protein INT45_010059 [Circinella minor]